MKKIVAPFLIAGALCAAAGAQAADTSPFYLSADAGRSQFKLDQGGLGSNVIAGERGLDFSRQDKKDGTYAIHAGYQITPNLALEAGYTDLGDASYTADIKPCPGDSLCFAVITPTTYGTLSASALDIAAVGKIQLAEKWYGYGKAGLSRVRVKNENSATSFVISGQPISASGNTISGTKTSIVPKLALGTGYQLTPAVGLQLEWNHYFKGKNDEGYARTSVNTVTAGVKVNF